MTPARTSATRALRDGIPIGLSVMPFGAIVGLSGVQVGLGTVQAAVTPFVVFAGASHLAALQLLATGAPLLVIWATGAIINLRFAMYATSLASYLAPVPMPWRLFLAYATTDQVFAMSMVRFRSADPPAAPGAYFAVLAGVSWLAWSLAGVFGATVGAVAPDSWQLDFVVPLIFTALLAGALKAPPTLVAAAVGGSVAVVAAPLPLNLGLIIGALAGIAAGAMAERAWPPAPPTRPAPSGPSGPSGLPGASGPADAPAAPQTPTPPTPSERPESSRGGAP